MRAFFILGLQYFCAVVVAADFQSSALGGDPPAQATGQNPPAAMPCPTISYPCVVPCPVVQYYPVCPPVLCPVISCYPVACPTVPSTYNQGAVDQGPANPSPNATQPAPAAESPADTAPSVDPTSAAPSSPVKVTAKQIDTILRCIDELFEANPKFQKCELMRVNPKQADTVFGKAWEPQGKAKPLTKKLWAGMHNEIYNAVHQNPQVAASYSPPVGFRVAISGTSCLPGEYVMLMFFERGVMELYFNGKPVGECPIYDDQRWEKILTQDGIPAPTSSSTN
jgi:hypothetical protein